jgi:hypothetical protein
VEPCGVIFALHHLFCRIGRNGPRPALKLLLTTFFFEVIELLLPQVAQYLSRDRIEFLDKEIFTDLTSGQRNEVDVLAKVKFRDKDAFFLMLAEPMSATRADYSRTMFHYVARLDEKYRLPVYPVAIFSFDKPFRPEKDQYQVLFPDLTVIDFRFRAIQLNRLDWKEFAEKDNPVASALMTRMRIAPQDRPKVKLACIRMMLRLKLTDAQRALIHEFIDGYLLLTAPERVEFEQEAAKLEPPEKERLMTIMNEWEQVGLEKGREQGLEKGREQGLAPFLRLLRRTAGDLSADNEQQIRKLSVAQLEQLADASVAFSSAADLQIWLDEHRGL